MVVVINYMKIQSLTIMVKLKLKKNMVICIEPMILAKSKEYYMKNDWDVIAINHHETAHCEDMILVTDDGYEILN